jgi:Dynamin family
VTVTEHPLHSDVLRLAEDAAQLLDRFAAAAAAAARSAPPGTPSLAPGTGDGAGSGVVPPGTAAAIRAEAAANRAGAATLVVVGEKKRGKSSLLNALVERPGLLPVEVDVATGTHILVHHADRPEALAYLDDGSTEPIALTDLTEYAAVDPVTQAPHRADVHHVEVGIPAGLLAAGLRLIDTPGVGGLVSGHARITMATLAHADALVFVVNGSTELTASELRFLAEATTRIAEVVFVLAQTDKYRSWPEVLERNRALLAEHAPRWATAPWYPVSSRAKEDGLTALAAGDRETAAGGWAHIAFDPLPAALTGRIAVRAAELRLANIVHVVRAGLAPAADAERRRLRSLAQDPALAAEIQRRRDALRALQEADAKWRATLRQASRELERRLRTGFRRKVNDLRQLSEERIALLSGPELTTELPRDLAAAIEAVWLELEQATGKGIAQLTDLMERECGIEDAEAAAGGLTRPDRLSALPPLIRTSHDGGGLLGAVENAMPTWGTAGFVAALAAAVFGGVLLPVTAGFGTIAVLSHRRRTREELARARTDTARYAQRLISELDTEVPPEITRAVDELTHRLTTRLAERITAERARTETELDELRRHAGADREQLARERELTERRAAVLAGLLRRAADLDARLGTGRADDTAGTAVPGGTAGPAGTAGSAGDRP